MSKQKKNKQFILITAGILVGLLLLVTILEKTGVTNFIKLPKKGTPTVQGPTPEQKQAEDTSNANSKQALVEDKSDLKDDTPNTTQNNPSTTSIALSAEQSGSTSVTVFTKLYGYSSGSCELKITNGTKSITQKADIIYQPEYSSCAGFSVPIETVGKGNWTIKLTTSGPTTESKTISFEVK